jgi:hypothetical protein
MTTTTDMKIGANYKLSQRAFYSAEAGVHDGLGRLISGVITDNDENNVNWNSAATYTANDSDFTYSFTVKHRLGGNPVAVMKDANGHPYYVIRSTGYEGPGMKSQKVIETIIYLKRISPFGAALVGCDYAKVTGSGLIDSYDSTLGTYASQVVGGHAKDHGTVKTCNAGSDIDITGSGTIYGDALAVDTVTKVGSGTVTGTMSGNQPASDCDPLDVTNYVASHKPAGSPPGGYSKTGSSSDTITVPAGNILYYDNFKIVGSGTVTINGTGDVTIFCTGYFKHTGSGALNLGSGITSLTIYTQGDVDISGSCHFNSGFETRMFIYSSTTTLNNGVSVTGSANVGFAVYAPKTEVNLTGSTEFFGAVRGKKAVRVGSGSIHYDESLANLGAGSVRGYVMESWRDILN